MGVATAVAALVALSFRVKPVIVTKERVVVTVVVTTVVTITVAAGKQAATILRARGRRRGQARGGDRPALVAPP